MFPVCLIRTPFLDAIVDSKASHVHTLQTEWLEVLFRAIDNKTAIDSSWYRFTHAIRIKKQRWSDLFCYCVLLLVPHTFFSPDYLWIANFIQILLQVLCWSEIILLATHIHAQYQLLQNAECLIESDNHCPQPTCTHLASTHLRLFPLWFHPRLNPPTLPTAGCSFSKQDTKSQRV